MPLTILTYLKEKFKMLAKFLTIPRFWGPVATVAFTIGYHLIVVYFGFSVTLSWLWLFMAIGVFIGGPWAGLTCSVFIVVYGTYALPEDSSRLIQLAISTPAAALLIGYLRHREYRLQRAMMLIFANGNVAKMREALALVTDLKHSFNVSSDKATAGQLQLIESNIGNSLAILDGYKFLREEIERVNEWYANPANVKRLQRMREEE